MGFHIVHAAPAICCPDIPADVHISLDIQQWINFRSQIVYLVVE